MKKTHRPIKLILGITAVPLVLFTVLSLAHLLGGKSYEGALTYCREHSKRGASEFVLTDSDSLYHKNYIYLVAKDGADRKGQELFVFRKIPFLGFFDCFVRYRPFASSADAGSNAISDSPIQLMRLTLKDDRGEKEPGQTLVFFSSNPDKNIASVSYILQDGDKQTKVEAPLHPSDTAMTLRLHWNGGMEYLGWNGTAAGIDREDTKARSVSDIAFYNPEGEILYQYE